MLTNQYYYYKIYKFLATACLVLFAVIAIFAGSTSWALAQELSPASGITGKINPKLSEDRSQAVEEKQFRYQVLVEEHINSDKLNNYVRLVTPKIIRGVNSAAAAELELINEKIKKCYLRRNGNLPMW